MIYLVSGYCSSHPTSSEYDYALERNTVTQWNVRAFEDFEIAKGFARELMTWFAENVEPLITPHGLMGTLEGKINPMDPLGTDLELHFARAAWQAALGDAREGLEYDDQGDIVYPDIGMGWWYGLATFDYGVTAIPFEYSEPLTRENMQHWEIDWAVIDNATFDVMESD